MPDVSTALARLVAVVGRVIETVGRALEMVPAITDVEAQRGRDGRLVAHFRSQDVLEDDVVVGGPGPSEAEESLEAIVFAVRRTPVAGGGAVEETQAGFPGIVEAIADLRVGGPGGDVLGAIMAELRDAGGVEVEAGLTEETEGAEAR